MYLPKILAGLLLVLLCNTRTFANDSVTLNNIIISVLEGDLENARLLLKSADESLEHKDILSAASQTGAVYEGYSNFVTLVTKQQTIPPQLLKEYVINSIPKPKPQIDKEYSRIINGVMSHLTNTNHISEANEVYEWFKGLINKYPKEDTLTMHARLVAMTHQIIMSTIQNDAQSIGQQSVQMQKIAAQYKDTSMLIASLYLRFSEYVIKQDLDSGIYIANLCWEYGKEFPEDRTYYNSNLINLINALIFKGGHEAQVMALLDELAKSNMSNEAFSLHLQLLSALEPGDTLVESILSHYGCTSIVELTNRLSILGEDQLDKNSQVYVLKNAAEVLIKYNELKAAIQIQRQLMRINAEIFRYELSEELANFKTQQAVKSKNEEIQYEKNQRNLYLLIAVLTALLLILSVVLIVRKQSQNTKLKKQASEIAKQRDQIATRDAEKADLIKEIHHRVKNNFQIVSSLLEMQNKEIDDDQAKVVAREGQNRIKSMSLIHQRLYQNDELHVQFDEYIKKLVDEIAEMYSVEDVTVKYAIASKNLKLDIDTAIPLGLIINELVTNAFKYGFDKTNKLLTIDVQDQAGELEISISDNGKSLNPDLDLQNAKSFGLKLVRRLTKQIGGRLKVSSLPNTRFTISFDRQLA